MYPRSSLQGVKWKRYHIQFSGDMVSWQEISIIQADANGIVTYTQSGNSDSKGYYRLLVVR